MNKHLLLIALSIAQISNSACAYRKLVRCVSNFTNNFTTKYSQATQLWYFKEFSKLSDSDKETFRDQFNAIIKANVDSNNKNKWIAVFNNQLKSDNKGYTVHLSPEFDLLHSLAELTIKHYNEEKNFASEMKYSFLNRSLDSAVKKLNEICNAEFDKKFAEFKLERTVESLTAFGQLVTSYFEFLQKCSDVMNEKI